MDMGLWVGLEGGIGKDLEAVTTREVGQHRFSNLEIEPLYGRPGSFQLVSSIV